MMLQFMAKLVCSVDYTIVFISITSFFQIATTFVMLCTFVHNFFVNKYGLSDFLSFQECFTG